MGSGTISGLLNSLCESCDLRDTIFGELIVIKDELDEIKFALIPEDEPSEDEIREIKLGGREMAEGKYRSWKGVKEEFG